MQAPTTPATIKLADGSTRVLRFSNGALKKLKQEFGVDPRKDTPKEMLEKIDVDCLPRVMVLALDHKWDDGFPGITEEQVDDLVETMAVFRPLMEALGVRYLDTEKTPEKNPLPAIEPEKSTTVM